MSQSQYSGSRGFTATAALGRGILVKLASENVVASAAATDATIGVTESSCEAGEVVSVRLVNSQGTMQVKIGGTVAVGNLLVTNASGLAIAGTQAIAGAQATGRVIGLALEAGVANDIIEVELMSFLF